MNYTIMFLTNNYKFLLSSKMNCPLCENLIKANSSYFRAMLGFCFIPFSPAPGLQKMVRSELFCCHLTLLRVIWKVTRKIFWFCFFGKSIVRVCRRNGKASFLLTLDKIRSTGRIYNELVSIDNRDSLKNSSSASKSKLLVGK